MLYFSDASPSLADQSFYYVPLLQKTWSSFSG
jgi:hypothetical protein